MFYLDKGYCGEASSNKKWSKFIDSIKTGKRVLLTRGTKYKRGGYVALWEVAGVRASSDGFEFEFTKQLIEF